MSDNKTAPITSSAKSLILPCLSLALTVAAFSVGAPVKLARMNLHPEALLTGLELDSTIRYEPVISTDRADYRLVGARRVLDEILSRQLIALR